MCVLFGQRSWQRIGSCEPKGPPTISKWADDARRAGPWPDPARYWPENRPAPARCWPLLIISRDGWPLLKPRVAPFGTYFWRSAISMAASTDRLMYLPGMKVWAKGPRRYVSCWYEATVMRVEDDEEYLIVRFGTRRPEDMEAIARVHVDDVKLFR
jgi:hypothetical protein